MNKPILVIFALLLFLGAANATTIWRDVSIPNAVDPDCRNVSIRANTTFINYVFMPMAAHQTAVVAKNGGMCSDYVGHTISVTFSWNGVQKYNRTYTSFPAYAISQIWNITECNSGFGWGSCKGRAYATTYHTVRIKLTNGSNYTWNAFTSENYYKG